MHWGLLLSPSHADQLACAGSNFTIINAIPDSPFQLYPLLTSIVVSASPIPNCYREINYFSARSTKT